ncbi:sensor histidine kinase [Sphingomonas sp. S2-65]|uniref:sensor histidine kinase n=1 Tax=Sphingomonas sp. S2-65 TaxID=2903960 RepID=UPI001F218DB3|nr:sensor histidine kinase [Sphingomonas sp. S2-65]UYY59982.1 sensor histidine kinase [Sphingomonas sp. S2-65]
MQFPTAPTATGQHWYQRIADVRSPWIWLAYLPLFGATWFGHPPGVRDLIVSAVGLLIFLALYVYAARAPARRALSASILIMALAFAMIPFGGNWTVLAVYACSTAAERRPARAAVQLVGILVLVSVAATILARLPWYAVAMLALFELMVVYGKMAGMALGEKHGALLRAQEEVRLLAREAERERIARDLHDVLGRTLTLIALKSDLAARLAASDPAAAEHEIRDVAEAARGALAEVRATVAGMNHAGLGREIEASRDALATAGIACDVDGEDLAISAEDGAVLAMALREAVTNVIRHAAATRCTILLEQEDGAARLTVSDNGRGGDFREGSGLRGMRARLSASGGRLRVDVSDRGTQVTAAVPAVAA